MTRFIAGIGDSGGWVVADTAQPGAPALPAVTYARRSQADAYADLLNAIDEEEPREIIERLREELDALRA